MRQTVSLLIVMAMVQPVAAQTSIALLPGILAKLTGNLITALAFEPERYTSLAQFYKGKAEQPLYLSSLNLVVRPPDTLPLPLLFQWVCPAPGLLTGLIRRQWYGFIQNPRKRLRSVGQRMGDLLLSSVCYRNIHRANLPAGSSLNIRAVSLTSIRTMIFSICLPGTTISTLNSSII